jgi:Bacteriocin-protection, YdeI or OmpD-Associated
MCMKSNVALAGGTVHELPADLKKAILSDKKVLALWHDITPLARNEWICWVTSGKLAETRTKRIKVGLSKMHSGMRRPCCWVGCIHRTDKAISPSAKWVLGKK